MSLPEPFGAPLDELAWEQLRAFLDLGEDESLTWEAKGAALSTHDVRKAASAFGNSERGGILVIGVARAPGTTGWSVDAWDPPGTEADLWISNVLDGVSPRPSTLVRTFPVDGGVVACLGVWPVGTPPVVTRSGQVFTRTSGASVTVADPQLLRVMFERGEAARSRAWAVSRDAADDLYGVPGDVGPLAVALGFGSVDVPSEVSALVFRRSFVIRQEDRMKVLHRTLEPANLAGFVRSNGAISQAAASVWTNGGFGPMPATVLRVGRHGGVAVGYADHPDVPSGADWARYSIDTVGRLWAIGRDVLKELGALGDVHVSARFSDTRIGRADAAAWTDADSDGIEEIGRITRDVGRAIGRSDFEPEPDE